MEKSSETLDEKNASRIDLENAESLTECQEYQQLSKNQLKRQKKKEKWLENKANKRKKEKEKRKRKFAEMKERGEDIGPSRKSLKMRRMADSSCKVRVAIDCSFEEYMSEKDTTFLVQQLQHSYAANRRAKNPLQLYICGITGKAKKRLDSIGDYKGWDLHKDERGFGELFSKDEIVYLSSESPNVLDRLDDSKVYIIGGLVDHNHYKGLCHRLAEENGFAHAQLPLSKFIQLKSRKVLTINHVFQILVHFTETNDWKTSFLSVIPQRKLAADKDSGDLSESPENALEDPQSSEKGLGYSDSKDSVQETFDPVSSRDEQVTEAKDRDIAEEKERLEIVPVENVFSSVVAKVS